MSAAAFAGTYADLKFVKTRKVAQITVEIPIEDAQRFVEAFGAPNPAAEIPVALARLTPGARRQPIESDEEGRKRRFNEMAPAAQIAMSCSSPSFREYLRTRMAAILPDDKDACDAYVKGFLGIQSKTEVTPGSEAFGKWTELRGSYEVWLKYERAA